MKRKISMLLDKCGVDDYANVSRKVRDNDPLKDYEFDESISFSQGSIPLLDRAYPFDTDDDIIVLPDFIDRCLN